MHIVSKDLNPDLTDSRNMLLSVPKAIERVIK